MAKLRGPLCSMDARGKFADTIVFSNWKGKATARLLTKPYNPRTTAQVEQRELLADAVDGWKDPSVDKDAWNAYAEDISTSFNPLSGANAFTREYIKAGGFPDIPA